MTSVYIVDLRTSSGSALYTQISHIINKPAEYQAVSVNGSPFLHPPFESSNFNWDKPFPASKLRYRLLIAPVFLFYFAFHTKAQSFSFRHLNTSNGLSDNNVKSVSIDKKGFLWVGTPTGLNLFDGYNVTIFKKENQPEMASNNVIHLTCDKDNRIWLGTPEGITWVDDHRVFHRVVLDDTVHKFGSRTIMDTKTLGPVIYTTLGQYYYDEKNKKWERLKWIPQKLEYGRFSDAEPFDDNQIIYATDSMVLLVDYANKKISFEYPLANVYSLCRYSDHEIAAGLQYGLIQIIDIRTGKVNKQYQLASEMNNKKITSTVTEVRLAVNGDLLVATGYAGFVIIDSAGNIRRYVHDPVNPGSVGSNLTWRVLSGTNGDIILGTRVAGVSMFNIYNKQAGYKGIFSDGNENYFDSYINEITEDKDEVLWMAAQDRLVKWDKENGKVSFYYYNYEVPPFGLQRGEFRTLCFDQTGKLWVSIFNDGISIFNPASGNFRKLNLDTSLGKALVSKYIHGLLCRRDGSIWVASNSGLFSVNSKNLSVTTYDKHPVLKELATKRIISIYEDAGKKIWIGTGASGIYCYDETGNTLMHFTTKDGLLQNTGYAMKQDRAGNTYVASGLGFNIIGRDNKISSFTRTEGLRYSSCQAFAEDAYGKIWISNEKCLVRFDPSTQNIQCFDESAGIHSNGFRTGCSFERSNGELVWGTQNGVNYFVPGKIAQTSKPLNVSIYGAALPDSTLVFSSNEKLSIPYDDNNINFQFTAINLSNPGKIEYMYMLEGFDRLWQKTSDIRQAKYTSLSPGDYVFKVKASSDGLKWTDASNEIYLSIIPPLWQRWWFIALCGSFLTGAIFLYVVYRSRRIQVQREELETEQAVNYFASRIYEHNTIEDILWDVAKNCIGRLNFEDCVIYIADSEKRVLIQKAAYGPKSPKHFEIDNPIEIPYGKGIVGSVALTRRGEIINDTTKDTRYIVDDERRLSEISVPIVSDNMILGVIDCEHSKKRFFTQKHLSILTTIASLCANKIVRARAELEKDRAQAELMETQRKMTEVEMQALRAQMNPHFIFNCLNSINRYIVKSDQATASLYLTKFAKLIRLILDNSNNKNVVLSHELEALKLYIDMEALRFDKKFSYSIEVDDNVNADSIELPPLIIQPYVENAIWHGLLHKENIGHLHVRIAKLSECMLECVIEDNGVGRDKAKELKSKSAITKKSLGMKLTENRLSLLNKHAELNASIEIVDLYAEGSPAGTKVILTIPI